MDLKSYIGRRLLLLIPTALGAILILFFLLQFISPTQRAMSFAQSPKEFAHLPEIIDKYNLDAPIHIQLYSWLKSLLHGNLGWSQTAKMPVTKAFVHYIPRTLELFMFATPIIIFAAVKMGVSSAVHHNEKVDHATRFGSIMGYAMPNFWLGILLLWIFYAVLGLFPPRPLSSTIDTYVASEAFTQYTRIHTIDAILNLDLKVLVNALQHLVLPVSTIVVSSWALITRITRSSMLEVLNRRFITTARAKGLDEDKVINKHARRNALIPVLTVSGYLIIGLLLGAFITETIFNFHGIGWFFVRSAGQNDYPVVIGFTLIFAVIILLVNLAVDIAYAYVDPRVKLE